MTDIETKWRKDRARLLVRVRAGAVPNEDSQEKYKLSLAEIKVVRVDVGLPKLDHPYKEYSQGVRENSLKLPS